MATSKENIRDFDFIFNEAIRLFELRKSSIEKVYKADFNNEVEILASIISKPKDIVSPNSYQKDFLVSSDSWHRLRNIATRSLESEGLTHKVSIDDYIQSIQESIYIHVMQGRGLDGSGYASILSTATKRTRYKMGKVTYYLPFNALIPKFKQKINLGLIEIVHKESVLNKIKNDSHYDLFVDNSSFNSYDSLIRITIPKASGAMSESRVNNVADFIYGVIQVFAKHHNADAKQLALINNLVKTNINYFIIQEDEFEVCGGVQFQGSLDQFWELFEADLNTPLGEIIKLLTEHSLNPRDKECLADRLIDAFYWYGEAVKDSNRNAQIIKLVTALERLVTFSSKKRQKSKEYEKTREGESDKDGEKKESKITKNFCNRIASSISIFHGEVNEYKNDLNKLYKLRSELVHGSISVHKKYDLNLDYNPFELASRAILSTCVAYYKMGLDLTNYEEKLEEMFNDLIEHCNNKDYDKKTNES